MDRATNGPTPRRTYRPLPDAGYMPTDAGILQSERDRRLAAELGSRELLKRTHALLVKMAGQV
jgi:hypothetical protein